MPDKPAILSEEALKEIEALSAKVPDGPWFTATDDADDVPEHRRSGLALVETGRSADWWIARPCEWHIAKFIAESRTNIDALCRTVRVLRAENTRVYTPSIVEALRLLDDAGFGKEAPNSLSSMIEKVLAQVNYFESPDCESNCRYCGQLRSVPVGHIQKCYCIPTIRRYRADNEELLQRLAQVEQERDRLRDGERQGRGIIRGWQKHIERMAKILNCEAMDIPVAQSAQSLVNFRTRAINLCKEKAAELSRTKNRARAKRQRDYGRQRTS